MDIDKFWNQDKNEVLEHVETWLMEKRGEQSLQDFILQHPDPNPLPPKLKIGDMVIEPDWPEGVMMDSEGDLLTWGRESDPIDEVWREVELPPTQISVRSLPRDAQVYAPEYIELADHDEIKIFKRIYKRDV